MAQVVTSGTSGTGRSGSPELRGTSGTRTRGLQIPWNKWNKDKGSVQLNLSSWPLFNYKTVEFLLNTESGYVCLLFIYFFLCSGAIFFFLVMGNPAMQIEAGGDFLGNI